MTKFKKEHEQGYDSDSDVTKLKGGWPDSGEGRYSQKLTYKAWYEFNCSERAHQNFVEQLPIILIFLILGSFFLPRFALYTGYLVAVSRPLYALAYIVKGPDLRFVNALANLSTYALGIGAFVEAL